MAELQDAYKFTVEMPVVGGQQFCRDLKSEGFLPDAGVEVIENPEAKHFHPNSRGIEIYRDHEYTVDFKMASQVIFSVSPDEKDRMTKFLDDYVYPGNGLVQYIVEKVQVVDINEEMDS